MAQNIDLNEIEIFLQENEPSAYLSQEEIQKLILENSHHLMDYYYQQQASNAKDLAPSVYFKSLNKIEQNLVKIMSNFEPKEFMSKSTLDEASRIFRDSKMDYYDPR